MIVPAIGGLTGSLGNAASNAASGAAGGAPAVRSGEAAALEGAGASAPAEGSTGGTPNFGSALTDAISSLETSQQSASAASQALATGTVSDPEAAVTTVEDAALTMQLAAQIRTKATEAAQTIFNTQV